MKHNNSKTFLKNSYYMYGKHPVLSALHNPNRVIHKVWCTENIYLHNKKIINNFPYEIVSDSHLNKLLSNNFITHQGIVAQVKSIYLNNLNIIDLNKPNCKIVILDQITDPQNIGSIIRSAVAFNIDAILLPQDNSPDESATISKASAGTIENIPIIKIVNIKNIIDFLKKQNFWIIGLDVQGTDKINNKLFNGKIAIILGAEGSGMRKLTKENCDFLIKIPINDKVESLNVANAASIIFYLTTLM